MCTLLAVTAVGTAASIGLGVVGTIQSANQAQASLNAQAQAQQNQLDFSVRQARQQQDMQRQEMMLSQHQHREQSILSQQQAAESRNLQTAQSNAQMLNSYNQQQQLTAQKRAGILQKHEVDKQSYQNSVEAAKAQMDLNNAAANRTYIAEQSKVDEARKKAAFEQQALLAKSIGAQGNILSAGRTGQSVGLLVKDVERQQGFGEAQALATLDSKRDASLIAMEGGWLSAKSANQSAENQVGFNPQNPYLPKNPSKPAFIDGIGLQIGEPA